MNDKLLPCPFCGGEARIVQVTPRLLRPSRNKPYSILCNGCDMFFGFDEDYGGRFNTKKEARSEWNRRTPDIVHCGECIHYEPVGVCELGQFGGERINRHQFCSNGERRS